MVKWLPFLAALAAVALLAAVSWRHVRDGLPNGALYEFRVKADGSMWEKGALPGRNPQEITSFLKELQLPPGSIVRAYRIQARPFYRLRFSGRVPEGTQQRVRNYLYLPG